MGSTAMRNIALLRKLLSGVLVCYTPYSLTYQGDNH